MRVDIVSSGLTKSDALAIERLLLLKHSQDELWKSKDYYPEEMVDKKFITDETILEMIDQLES